MVDLDPEEPTAWEQVIPLVVRLENALAARDDEPWWWMLSSLSLLLSALVTVLLYGWSVSIGL